MRVCGRIRMPSLTGEGRKEGERALGGKGLNTVAVPSGGMEGKDRVQAKLTHALISANNLNCSQRPCKML